MQKIVHLDLKGAPLKICYLEKVLRCIKSWGATGILIEWEDTFPYDMELEVIGSIGGCGGDGMYSREEVLHLLQFSEMNGLEPIQLVQTIGHMEFVLKHPSFKKLRENPGSPTSLCPCSAAGQRLVRAMLLQLLRVQPRARSIHIGADEVWCYGECEACRLQIQLQEVGAPSLYLEHIRNLALFIKTERPDITVLFWDDQLRSLDLQLLKVYNLGELLEPVLWYYNSLETFNIEDNLLEKYSQAFPYMWAASAYKGANGSCKMRSCPRHYTGNHAGWLAAVARTPRLRLRGLVLTGWSRFDHYATLCELLPVSMPTLAACLKLLTNFDETKEISSLEVQQLDSREWPGHELAAYIETYDTVRARIDAFLKDDHVRTWLNPWQVANNYTNPAQVSAIYRTALELLRYAEALTQNIQVHLQEITGSRSVNEWIHTNCTSDINRLKQLCEVASERSNADAGIRPTT